jgi:hypothetical protein
MELHPPPQAEADSLRSCWNNNPAELQAMSMSIFGKVALRRQTILIHLSAGRGQ